jgi:hypothetical protein
MIMAVFENSLRVASLAILKRDLTESERIEFLDLAGSIGMSSVEDYLYMLMVFKRNEDNVGGMLACFRDEIRARFDEMGALERKIDATLESSISRVLGDGAREISRSMGGEIAESAKDVLSSTEEFHFLRGQTFVTGAVITISVVAYLLGAVYGFGSEGEGDFLDILLRFPAGGVIFVCGSAYAVMWSSDHWRLVKRDIFRKALLGLQIMVLTALFVYFLR